MNENYRYFKYRTINKRLIDSLVTNTWYFAKPDTLNDPFDCRIDLRKAMARAAENANGPKAEFYKAALGQENGILEHAYGKLTSVGVCSFSLSANNDLLWAHYADNHRGVCLHYEFTESFLTENRHKILGVDVVKYDKEGLTDWLKQVSIANGSPATFLEALTRVFLTAKSPAWEIEGEVRILRSEPGLVEIPRTALTGVCFGLRTPEEDIRLVSELASKYSDCTVFSRMQHDDSDYGYTSKPL